MKLIELNIELQRSYDDNPGKYKGVVKYEGNSGKVELLLDEKISEAVLLCIGQCVTKFTAAVSKQLEADIHQSIQEAQKPQMIES
jgi:leucyl aminopeptidase (aminopeptidase T)